MNSVVVFVVSAISIFSGTLIGVWLRNRLPEHHLSSEGRETVKAGAGMIATLAALVLGLLVSSAKSSFDGMNQGIMEAGTRLILLDRSLRQYGPEAQPIREGLRDTVLRGLHTVWPETAGSDSGLIKFEEANGMEVIQSRIRQLTPRTPEQREAQTQALQISTDLLRSRWSLIEAAQSRLPVPFLVIVLFWLSLLFMSFGLLAPKNPTVLVVLFLSALSVSGALFLIVEMNHPFDGIIKLSNAPLLKAVEHISR